MEGIVDMGAWNRETRSNFYADWSERAQRINRKVTSPIKESPYGNHIFLFSTHNPDAKKKVGWLINIELTERGEFRFVDSFSKKYPLWYVEDVSKYISELYKAFAEEGFII